MTRFATAISTRESTLAQTLLLSASQPHTAVLSVTLVLCHIRYPQKVLNNRREADRVAAPTPLAPVVTGVSAPAGNAHAAVRWTSTR